MEYASAMNPLERFLGRFQIESLIAETDYSPAKTVGTVRVKDVLTIGQNPLFEIVFLDLKEEGKADCSRTISKVPPGLFKPGAIAEVIVKASEGNWYDPAGIRCEVAIRPFRPNTYGTPIDESDPEIKEMFEINVKDYVTCPAFFNKFMR